MAVESKQNTRYAATVSGGKDSIAMSLRLWELGYKFTILSVFTEFEFPAIKQQVYKLIEVTKLPHIILKVPEGTWDKWFYGKIKRGKLKGEVRGVRFVLNKKRPYCWYKREAKEKFFYQYEPTFDKIFVGIRYDEQKRAKNNAKYEYPLITWKWTKKHVEKYLKQKNWWIKEYELFPHTGCYLCPYQTEKTWQKLKIHYPNLYNIALKYHLDNLKLIGIPIIPPKVLNQASLDVF